MSSNWEFHTSVSSLLKNKDVTALYNLEKRLYSSLTHLKHGSSRLKTAVVQPWRDLTTKLLKEENKRSLVNLFEFATQNLDMLMDFSLPVLVVSDNFNVVDLHNLVRSGLPSKVLQTGAFGVLVPCTHPSFFEHILANLGKSCLNLVRSSFALRTHTLFFLILQRQCRSRSRLSPCLAQHFKCWRT